MNSPSAASAPAPITGLSSMATRQFLADAVQAWREAGGSPVRIESVGGVDALQRALAGEQVDLVVLASPAIGQLDAAGTLASGACTELATSAMAAAVRAGRPVPDLHDDAGLRAALLSARAIGYSTGPSGRALIALLQRWDLADRLLGRMVEARPGVPVASLLLHGDVDLGFQQRSELIGVDGLALAGPLPDAPGFTTTFSGAVTTVSAQPQAAEAFLSYLSSPALDSVKRRNGLEPSPARRALVP